MPIRAPPAHEAGPGRDTMQGECPGAWYVLRTIACIVLVPHVLHPESDKYYVRSTSVLSTMYVIDACAVGQDTAVCPSRGSPPRSPDLLCTTYVLVLLPAPYVLRGTCYG